MQNHNRFRMSFQVSNRDSVILSVNVLNNLFFLKENIHWAHDYKLEKFDPQEI